MLEWVLIIALHAPSNGNYVDKVVVGPFPNKTACDRAKVEGVQYHKTYKQCITLRQWQGKPVDPKYFVEFD